MPGTSKGVAKAKTKVDIVGEQGTRSAISKRPDRLSIEGADELSTQDGADHVARKAVPNLNNDPASDDVARRLVMLKQRQDLEKRRLELELQLKFVCEEEELLRVGKVEFSTVSPQFNSFQPEESAAKTSKEDSDVTPRQAVARKNVPKELPTFTGDPAEWPIFISHYENTTRRCGYSNWENMLRLQKCLKGPALEAVSSRLMLPESVPQVIEKLRSRYGRPVHLIKTLIAKVRKIPAPQVDKLESIIEYGEAVQSMVDHMEAAGARAHLTNPILLEEVVGKLPNDQQLLWAHHIRGVDEDSLDLVMFSDYMEKLAEDAARLTTVDSPSMRGSHKGKRSYVNTHLEADGNATSIAADRSCLFCHGTGHGLTTCYKFKNLPVKDRWQKARELSVCFSCLGKHNWRNCRNRAVCGIGGCTYRHHALLHDKAESSGGAGEGRSEGGVVAESNHHQYTSSTAIFRIVPVTLYGPARNVSTFAFLDEGSSVTLMDEDVAVQLGVEGVVEPLCMRWTGNTQRIEMGSRRVDLKVGPSGSLKKFAMNSVRTVPNLNLPKQTFQLGDGMGKHLQRLPLRQYREAEPKLLIGLDNLRLAVPLRTKEGKEGEPIAVKTRLGWCIYGKPFNGLSEQLLHICECNSEDSIHQAMRKFCETEQLGVSRVVEVHPDDQRAQKILDETTVRVGNHFESGLLWKTDSVELPPSREMAQRRHVCLERRMERDNVLKEQVHRQIGDLASKGYIHKASEQELVDCDEKRVWYLPIGVVTNPNKPGKVRLIWDAAAKAHGKSLNDHLLKGPDDLLPLPGVLYRFRLYGVATCADVKEMFLQIRIHATRTLYDSGEWHVFVDASQHAYACALYLRIIDATGEPQCTLIGGKAKVAPLKPLSIPKLELQACVLGARMLQFIQNHHPLGIRRRVLWTDSTVALSWIRADPRNYKPFVAHRVGEILETTSPEEWRWVPTDCNPADEATKWKGRLNCDWDSIWFQGPNFLLQPEDEWPTQRGNNSDTVEEQRRIYHHVEESNYEILPLKWERFSRFEKLQRTVGWIVRYVDNLERKMQGKPEQGGVLRQEELVKANNILWRQTQLQYYADEVRALRVDDGDSKSGRRVTKQSPIYKLSPFMDEDGVLRMRGRVGAAVGVPYCAKYPVILPRTSKLGELIVERYHRIYRHANKETIVNEVRQHYQIPKLRTLVNRIARNCVVCKIRRSLPQVPPMAPLPKERLTPFIRPFSFTGLDYFGPVKVVHNLSTESCVMAVRRFVARRGAPVEIFSDNGTNFLGASRQLRKEIEERNGNLAATFTNAHTRWTFNPPGAPHMGGVWERMVRSVKAAISTVMEINNKPDDETFETVLLDAEAMVNSRPLTYIPVDPENQEALTPNHFLLGSSSGVKQRPALPTCYSSGLKNNYRLAQHILDDGATDSA
ncbi:uncharacterized protein LOC128718710 [Anopheles marshallii]|uniref:uncharacterized protein LOC128718710 n=1 Tax=Anopheles marshallii TaxID=1521116 RepID=UPI00237A8185|nr:uncharacterized protein LOC128718710 [Anopheles marshallii]